MNTLHQTDIRSPETLYHAALRLKKLNNLRQRDIAQSLQVSECEVLASRCGLPQDELGQVRRLNCTPTSRMALFEAFPKLGRIMSMTRNESAVHERKGKFETISVGEQMGLVLGNDIDLRLIFKNWHYAYAVTDMSETRTLYSLQFFDATGCAVYKLYATDDTDMSAWDSLVHNHMHTQQAAGEFISEVNINELESSSKPTDIAQFQTDWHALTDVHQFHPMLKRHGLSRIDAMKYAPDGRVSAIKPESIKTLLDLAAEQELPIMIFVGNRGCVQIHTGVIQHIVEARGWLNILDPDFNLHLKIENIDSAWVVRRPSSDGQITCIDYFDHEQNLILSVFGKRIPFEPELPAWQALAEDIARTFSHSAQVA